MPAPIFRKVKAVKPMSERFPDPKPTQQYEKPIGPEKPVKVSAKEKLKQGVKKTVEYAAPKIKRAGQRVAQNAQRSSQRDSGMINIRPPADMFSFQAPSFMMGPPSAMMGMGQPEPAPRPRRRKKPKPRVGRKQPREQSWQQLGGVPDSVKRWMM